MQVNHSLPDEERLRLVLLTRDEREKLRKIDGQRRKQKTQRLKRMLMASLFAFVTGAVVGRTAGAPSFAMPTALLTQGSASSFAPR